MSTVISLQLYALRIEIFSRALRIVISLLIR